MFLWPDLLQHKPDEVLRCRRADLLWHNELRPNPKVLFQR
jgi:hypothetical protein